MKPSTASTVSSLGAASFLGLCAAGSALSALDPVAGLLATAGGAAVAIGWSRVDNSSRFARGLTEGERPWSEDVKYPGNIQNAIFARDLFGHPITRLNKGVSEALIIGLDGKESWIPVGAAYTAKTQAEANAWAKKYSFVPPRPIMIPVYGADPEGWLAGPLGTLVRYDGKVALSTFDDMGLALVIPVSQGWDPVAGPTNYRIVDENNRLVDNPDARVAAGKKIYFESVALGVDYSGGPLRAMKTLPMGSTPAQIKVY